VSPLAVALYALFGPQAIACCIEGLHRF